MKVEANLTSTGGYPKFVAEGLNNNWLPVWLQQAGYNTYYTGKLFNAHTVDNYNRPFVNGFTGSEFLLDPFTYQYYNASMSRNGNAPVNYLGQYSNDLVANKAYGFLDDAITAGKPFFLGVAPIAPHCEFRFPACESPLHSLHYRVASDISKGRQQHQATQPATPTSSTASPSPEPQTSTLNPAAAHPGSPLSHL